MTDEKRASRIALWALLATGVFYSGIFAHFKLKNMEQRVDRLEKAMLEQVHTRERTP